MRLDDLRAQAWQAYADARAAGTVETARAAAEAAEAVARHSESDEHHCDDLWRLGWARLLRWQSGDEVWFDGAVEAFRRAGELAPDDVRRDAAALAEAVAWRIRAGEDPRRSTLDAALDALGPGAAQDPAVASLASEVLVLRYAAAYRHVDLDAAISSLGGRLVQAAPGARPSRTLAALGLLLLDRYESFHDHDDLYDSIGVAAEAYLVACLDTEEGEEVGEEEDDVGGDAVEDDRLTAGRLLVTCLRALPDTLEAGALAAEVLHQVVRELGGGPAAEEFLLGSMAGLYQSTGRPGLLVLVLDFYAGADVGDVEGRIAVDVVGKWTAHRDVPLADRRFAERVLTGLAGLCAHGIRADVADVDRVRFLVTQLSLLSEEWGAFVPGLSDEALGELIGTLGPLLDVVTRREARTVLLAVLSTLRLSHFNRTGGADAGDAMVRTYRELAVDGPDAAQVGLANALLARYHGVDDAADLDEAIAVMDALGDLDYTSALLHANALLLRHDRAGAAEDWLRAFGLMDRQDGQLADEPRIRAGFGLVVAELGVDVAVHDFPLPRELTPRLCALCERAMLVVADPDRRRLLQLCADVVLDELAAAATPAGLEDVGAALARAIAAGDADAREEADRRARRIFAEHEAQVPGTAKAFGVRLCRAATPEALWLGIAALRAHLDVAPVDHRARWVLGRALFDRHGLGSDPRDLDDAIGLLTGVLPAVTGGPARASLLNDLAGAHIGRFERSGDRTALTRSIEAMREAVALTPDDVTFLVNLAQKLSIRSRVLGSRTDLDESLAHAERARQLLDDATDPTDATGGTGETDAVDRFAAHNALAGGYRARFALDGDPADLERALTALRASAEALPEGHPQHAVARHNLASFLLSGASGGQHPVDPDEVVDLCLAAVRGARPGHPERNNRLITLAKALLHRATTTSARPDDRTGALRIMRDRLADYGPTEPKRFEAALFLAAALSSDPDASEDVVRLFQEAVRSPHASAEVRLLAGVGWAEAAERAGSTSGALAAWDEVIGLLGLIAWGGIARGDQERLLARYQDHVARAAAFAIDAGEPVRALDLLERGRSILWKQVADPLADAASAPPDWPAAGDAASAPTDRRATGLPAGPAGGSTGLADLDLGDAAAIVLTTHGRRGHALIVERGEVRAVRLRGLTADDVVRQWSVLQAATNAFAATADPEVHAAAQQAAEEVLDWLWRAVVGRVLAALPERAGKHRLFWCPTGALSMLPLHAATDVATGRSCLDVAVSSYVPSLRSLAALRARQGEDRDAIEEFLTVAVETHPDEQLALAHVRTEVAAIEDLLPNARHTALLNLKATRAAACEELGRHRYVHFSCHGAHDPGNPSAGGMVLTDGVLSIVDIAGVRSRGAQLAFLSACRTAMGELHLADESVHLGAALFLIGFRQVIGTLWAVDDRLAAEVAQEFYRRLAVVGPTSAPAVIAEVALSVRRQRADEPLAWAGYVHIGA